MRPLARAATSCCNPEYWQSCGASLQALDRWTRGTLRHFICPPGKPSPIFLIYTTLFNLVPGVLHFSAAIILLHRACHSNCDPGLVKFLLFTVLINGFFMAFAIHVHKRFSEPYTAPTPEQRSPLHRAWDIFMDDPWVSVCVLVVIACFPTIFFGFSWDFEGSCECDPDFPGRVGAASLTLLCYLLGAGFICCISLCVESYRHSDAETEDPYGPRYQGGILRYLNGPGARPSTDVPAPIAPPGAGGPYPVTGSGYAAYLAATTSSSKPPKAGSSSTPPTYGTYAPGAPAGVGSSTAAVGYQSGYGAIPSESHFYPTLDAPAPYQMKPGKTVD